MERTIMEQTLQHHGVKGQRWGVIRSRSAARVANIKSAMASKVKTDPTPKVKKVGRLKGEIRSVKRQLAWSKSLKDKSKMTDEELRTVTARIGLENNLRKLAKRKEYLKRSDLSDAELNTRVKRLSMEDTLKKNVNESQKAQKAFGDAVKKGTLNVGTKMIVKGHDPFGTLVKNEVKDQLTKKYPKAGAAFNFVVGKTAASKVADAVKDAASTNTASKVADVMGSVYNKNTSYSVDGVVKGTVGKVITSNISKASPTTTNVVVTDILSLPMGRP